MKYTATTSFSQESGQIYLDTSLQDSIRDAQRMISREVINLKEKAVREALIALGWTPPQP